MKKAIHTRHVLEAPIDAVWDQVKSGANWENWMPILADSRVSGDVRYCTLESGDELEEKFLASDAEKTFIYSIVKQASFPAENILGLFRLSSEDGKTIVHWSVEMELESEDVFTELKPNIEEIYRASTQKLDQLVHELIAA